MTIFGGVLAIVDRRVLIRWLFAPLLVAGIAGGVLLTRLSPFSFGGTSYYMQGVIISGACALALIGYVTALAALIALKRFGRQRN